MSLSFAGPSNPNQAEIFVGRERELAELSAGWEDVIAGRGRVFLLYGEAGIGKTRLAEAIAAEAGRAGATVAWGRCWEDDGAPALWPWIQIVRKVARELKDAEGAIELGPGAAYVVQLVPEVADLLPGVVAGGSRTRSAPEAEFPMLDGLAAFLGEASASRPLVLIFDDLHAADLPSLLALDFLARELPQRRILVLGTYREVEASRASERIELLHRIARQGRRVALAGLSEDDIRRLIELAFVRSPAASVVRALHRSTDGNPFFLDEVVRLLLASSDCADLDHVPASGLPLPLAVRDAVRQRLQPLSKGCRALLRTASVIGRRFRVAALCAATGHADAVVRALLDEAVASVLVTPPPQPHGEYSFVHALVRDTLYDDLPAAERMRLHTHVGAVLEELYAADTDAHIAELANHALHGDLSDGIQPAVDLAVRAARRAESVAAFGDAAQWYERARSLVCEAAPGTRPCIELWLAKGEAQSKGWNTDSARSSFAEAARLAQAAVGTAEPDARRLFARATLGMGGTGIGIPRGVVDDTLVELLESAVTMSSSVGDRALEARLRSRLALELYFSNLPERRRELMDEARALAEESGDAEARAYVANARLVTDWDVADARERLRHADTALAAAVEVGAHDLEFRARVFRVLDLVELGDFAGWQQEIERFARVVAEHRLPVYESTLETLRIMTALWLGRHVEAEAMCLQQLAKAERWEDPHARVSVYVQILALRLACGGVDEVLPVVSAAAAQPDAKPEVLAAHAMLLRAAGRTDDARDAYETLAAEDFADLARGRHLMSTIAWLVELACDYGERRHLEALRSYLQPVYGANLQFVSRLCHGPSEHFLGRLEAALGNPEGAVRLQRVALERSEASRGRPAAARIRRALGSCLLSLDDAECFAEAATVLAAARAEAVELGMQPLVQEIDACRARLDDAEANAAADQAGVVAEAGHSGRRGGRVLPFPRGAAATPPRRRTQVADGSGGRGTPVDTSSRFHCDDGFCTIAHRGTVLRLKGTKGLRYLAELLRYPGREIHVMDLAAVELPPAEARDSGILGEGMHVDRGAAPALLDRQARQAYRQRLEDLHEELREVTEFHDRGRMAKVQAEIDALTAELARSFGLGGRARAPTSSVERTRLNVTRALQTAIKRIREGHPELGRHFAETVRTGTFCCYRAPAGQEIDWQL